MPSCAGCTDGIVVGNLRQAGLPRTKAAGFPSGVVDALDQPNSGLENVSFSVCTRTSRSNHLVPSNGCVIRTRCFLLISIRLHIRDMTLLHMDE
mgnify:CR=1 FL=1